jgi:hypothetical protein
MRSDHPTNAGQLPPSEPKTIQKLISVRVVETNWREK